MSRAEEVFEENYNRYEHLGEEEFEMSKIESAELGNTSEGFKHEIVKEKPESSQVESHEDMSKADMEETEGAFEGELRPAGDGCQSAPGQKGI